jgi:hypothetical protein
MKPSPQIPLNRREFLQQSGAGFGGLALTSLLQQEAAGASSLAVKQPHHPARAKHVVHLFMNGGPSQVDTFDRKTPLDKYDGQTLPVHYKTERKTGVAYKSPFAFDSYGQSGIEVSELFAQTAARHIDDLCLIRSTHCSVPNHPPSMLEMTCGDPIQSRPSMGAWTLYGLGTENQNLPDLVSLCPEGYPGRFGPRYWGSSFLSGAFQGQYINTQFTQIDKLIDHIRNGKIPASAQKRQLDLLRRLHEEHIKRVGDEGPLEARIQSFDLAFRMQSEAAEVFDVSREPVYIREMYGDTVHGRQLLITRRLIERGVRFVQAWTGTGIPWDHHDDIMLHRRDAAKWDQPIAAFLTDLKQRGLLDETLVLWGGEFGRTPTVELPAPGTNKGLGKGRDHNNHGFTVWLAGGGVKGGHIHGATDEFGFKAVEDRVHIHDLHATMLHLLGLDHERLTYRYSGRDFRLTDVAGRVVDSIIA